MLLAILELHINIHECKRGEKSKETTKQGLAVTALGYRGRARAWCCPAWTRHGTKEGELVPWEWCSVLGWPRPRALRAPKQGQTELHVVQVWWRRQGCFGLSYSSTYRHAKLGSALRFYVQVSSSGLTNSHFKFFIWYIFIRYIFIRCTPKSEDPPFVHSSPSCIPKTKHSSTSRICGENINVAWGTTTILQLPAIKNLVI